MTDYKEMYYKLFNRITDIIDELKEIQNEAEEIFIRDSELRILVIKNDDIKKK